MFLLLSAFGCIDGDAPAHPEDHAERVFVVPSGRTARGLGPALVAEGVVASESKWTWFLRLEDGSCVKAGRHPVRGDMSMREVLASLCGNPLPEDEPFTVVEGWRIRDIDAALAEKGWIRAGDYAALAQTKQVDLPFPIDSPSLEGYLYPETYLVVPSSFSAKDLIERQLATFRDRFLAEHPDGFGTRSLHDVVVVASMLEREEPNPDNRPLVAGVIWKRLDAGWALGIDATSRYTLANWNDRGAFLDKLKDPNDVYGTRVRKGLPPGAIGNPTRSSLEAAVQAKPSEFWYYLHDGEGVLHPARTVVEHEANRARYGVY
jgi:UPF0755 protein